MSRPPSSASSSYADRSPMSTAALLPSGFQSFTASDYPTSSSHIPSYPSDSSSLPSFYPPDSSRSSHLDTSFHSTISVSHENSEFFSQLENAQLAAIGLWQRRLITLFAFHVTILLFLLASYYYFTSIIGLILVVAFIAYAYATKQQKRSFLLGYFLLASLNLCKDFVLLYFYFSESSMEDRGIIDYFTIIALLLDSLLLTPITVYCCFWLYRSISLTHFTF
jgi:hypothetical protein